MPLLVKEDATSMCLYLFQRPPCFSPFLAHPTDAHSALAPLQDFSPHAEALQPSIVASGLQGHYHACIELARAVREAVRAVLRVARLPALLQGGEQYGECWRVGRTEEHGVFAFM